MFTIDSEARVTPHPATGPAPGADNPATTDAEAAFASERGLGDLVQTYPGEWAVKVWNRLAEIEPMETPILTKKFRNRQTAAERIWNRLAELYPDAILESDMPKKKAARLHKPRTEKAKARAAKQAKAASNGHKKSAWAEELTAKLIDEFRPGQAFTVEQVYGFEPSFRPKHRENKNIRAKLRQTLAILRGAGFLKQVGRGKYERKAAR